MAKTERLVIVSDGFSGWHAAIEAARCGLPSIFLDASPSISDFSSFLADTYPELADLVQVGSNVQVLGIFEGREILWSQGETTGTFRADQILLATGSWDRILPFPGWDLPGVISHGMLTKPHPDLRTGVRVAGVEPRSGAAPGPSAMPEGRGQRRFAARPQPPNAGSYFVGVPHEQALLSRSGQIRTEKRAIVAGMGSNGLINSAQQLVESGVEVVAILDVGSETGRSDRFPLQRFGDFPDLIKIPYFPHHALFEAFGAGRVTQVTFGEIDPRTWTPCEGPSRTEEVDLVVVGFGRVPNHRLAAIAGCKQHYQPDTWTWGPIRDPLGRTSVPGIFAMNQGEGDFLINYNDEHIAAITAAEQAGLLSAIAAAVRRAAHLELVANLKRTSRVQTGLLDLMRPDTIVCKCENITLAEVHRAIDDGARDLTSLKLRTRLGMGSCQGRDCACSAAMIVCRATGRLPEAVGTIHARPPATSVSLGALASMEGRLPSLDREEL